MTHPAIRIIEESLNRAEENNHSTIHAFEDGVDKARNNSLLNRDERERALVLNLLLTRQATRSAATEQLISKSVESIRLIDESDDAEIRPSDISTMYNIIDNLQFYELVSTRNVGSINIDYLINEASGASGMNQSQLDVFIKAIEEPLIETDEYVHDILSSLIDNLSEILGETPSEEEWNRAFIRFNETYVELDTKVRFAGDVA